MDIFFARQAQIEHVLASDTDEAWKNFAEHVRAQKASYFAAKARAPEWSWGAPVDGATTRIADPNDATVLSGIPGSAGMAEGEVFLVLSSDDFARFPRNAVLVARTTNPTWTPLFYNAAAVVTESGGPLSHGAVTAREMRLPAVMAVKHSLTRLRNGQRVRVDGTGGRVHLLNTPN
jgi:pyruvate,water dikinase